MFVLCLGIQGAGDNSLPVGYALLADYVSSSPQGHSGSADDSLIFQFLYKVIRLGSNISPVSSRLMTSNHARRSLLKQCKPLCPDSPHRLTASKQFVYITYITGSLKRSLFRRIKLTVSSLNNHSYIERELNTQYTMVLVLQTLGALLGYGLGDLFYIMTGSIEWAIAIGGCVALCLFAVGID